MGKLEEYKARVSSQLMSQRAAAGEIVGDVEIVLGSFAGGYIAAQKPDVAGVPTDAAMGLVLYVAGASMKQKHLKRLGVGFLAGYAHDFGVQAAQTTPLPFNVINGGQS